MLYIFIEEWKIAISRVESKSIKGRNKLQNYSLYKTSFYVEPYCQLILPPKHRSSLSKFRCGVAPIIIETGRYENICINDRKCPYCDDIETEIHVLF